MSAVKKMFLIFTLLWSKMTLVKASDLTTNKKFRLQEMVQKSTGNGNGGGAIVCRKKTKVYHAEFLELYNAKRLGLKIKIDKKTSAETQAINAIRGLLKINRYLYQEVAKELNLVQRKIAWALKDPYQKGNSPLPVLDHGLVMFPDECPNPRFKKVVPHFETVVNYQDNGHLLVSGLLYNKLAGGETARAAVQVHEAINRALKDYEFPNTIIAQVTTALLFSSKDHHGLLQKFLEENLKSGRFSQNYSAINILKPWLRQLLKIKDINLFSSYYQNHKTKVYNKVYSLDYIINAEVVYQLLEERRTNEVKFLIKNSSMPKSLFLDMGERKDLFPKTPLMFAFEQGDLELAEMIFQRPELRNGLSNEAYILKYTYEGKNAGHIAFKKGYLAQKENLFTKYNIPFSVVRRNKVPTYLFSNSKFENQFDFSFNPKNGDNHSAYKGTLTTTFMNVGEGHNQDFGMSALGGELTYRIPISEDIKNEDKRKIVEKLEAYLLEYSFLIDSRNGVKTLDAQYPTTAFLRFLIGSYQHLGLNTDGSATRLSDFTLAEVKLSSVVYSEGKLEIKLSFNASFGFAPGTKLLGKKITEMAKGERLDSVQGKAGFDMEIHLIDSVKAKIYFASDSYYGEKQDFNHLRYGLRSDIKVVGPLYFNVGAEQNIYMMGGQIVELPVSIFAGLGVELDSNFDMD